VPGILDDSFFFAHFFLLCALSQGLLTFLFLFYLHRTSRPLFLLCALPQGLLTFYFYFTCIVPIVLSFCTELHFLSFACFFSLYSSVHISVISPYFVSFLDSIPFLSFRFSLFRNIISRVAFGSKRKEATKCLRIWHTGKIHDLYSKPVIVRMTRSRMMR
jgi:hypothetical protein